MGAVSLSVAVQRADARGARCGLLNETELPSFGSRGQVTALTSGSCVSTFPLIIVSSEGLMKGCLVPAG